MRRLQYALLDRRAWNPVHAAAYGIGAGFLLFVVQLIHSEAWSAAPAPQLYESSLTLMLLLAVSFALIAIARNRRVRAH